MSSLRKNVTTRLSAIQTLTHPIVQYSIQELINQGQTKYLINVVFRKFWKTIIFRMTVFDLGFSSFLYIIASNCTVLVVNLFTIINHPGVPSPFHIVWQFVGSLLLLSMSSYSKKKLCPTFFAYIVINLTDLRNSFCVDISYNP